MPPVLSPGTPRFQHGEFFGHYAHRRQVAGLALADLAPTLPEHAVHTHTHDDAHFLLLLGGTYLSTARGMPAACVGPTLVLNPPGTTHRDCFQGDGEGGRFFTVSLTAADWQAANEAQALPAHALRLPASTLLPALRLWREMPNWDDASQLIAEAETQQLLAEAAFAARLANDTGPAWLARACERLRDDSEHRPSLDRALVMLSDPDVPLAQVAARCGFSDQAHFSHAFRRQHGLSPLAYRRLARPAPGSVRTRTRRSAMVG